MAQGIDQSRERLIAELEDLAQLEPEKWMRAERMNLLPRRCILAIAAVVDIALNARQMPVAAKALAERHDLPARHLESLLQSLVRADILKGVRGPRGGYELARERRRISAGEVVRAVLPDVIDEQQLAKGSRLAVEVVLPIAIVASSSLLDHLDSVFIAQLCDRATEGQIFSEKQIIPDFTI